MSGDPLSLFPARIAIGSYTDAKGQRQLVYMTPEFYRAMRSVLIALGGPASDASTQDSIPDVFAPFFVQDEGMNDAPIVQPVEAEILLPDVTQAPEAASPLALEMTTQPH